MKKLYCNVSFDRGNTLVRVDSEKEYSEILNQHADEFLSFFKRLLIKKSQNSLHKPEPYKIFVSDEKFNSLTNIIKKKLGRSEDVVTSKINLVYNSNSYPVIQIVKN